MGAIGEEFAALAEHLHRRRGEVLQVWRDAVRRDPTLTSGDSMPRSELNDHIPVMLSAFERELRRQCRKGDASEEGGTGDTPEDAAAHGLHRWQQGYDLQEVTCELGRLNECMVIELDDYEKSNPGLAPDMMATARRIWAAACTEGISASAAQYFRLQQLEAAGHVGDLERALEDIRELEQQRAELWQQAAHDLRGNLGVVANATAGLVSQRAPAGSRDAFLRLLQRNVTSLHLLLDDVTSLARLQAGKEARQLSQVDIARLLRELCEGLKPLAAQRGLYFHVDGPAPFIVEADAVKIRRLAQNLILNAVKYTLRGGVAVTWGNSNQNDGKRWALAVKDTGPGIHAGPGALLAGALEEATNLALEPVADPAKEIASPSAPGALPAQTQANDRAVNQAPGEGIGLSIVKRLCELLDATVELSSDEAKGTDFRILLPRRYQSG